ncbi:MAG: flagellin [Succinimonas sp.]|nr:flagellin [Succinimonas sp.]
MALYITNIASINAQRMLANSTNALDTSYKRLASGLRINSAKDDAAGLQIADRLTSQINGLKQGNRNAMDGISFAQTAEGAMDEMVTMYQRIRTLALQSANGTNSDADRTAIQQEVSSLCAEIDRISKDTTYGGQNIFERAASDRTISFQVGADANQTISMNLAAKFQKPKEGGGTEEVTAGKWSVKELAAAMGISDGIAECSATDFSGSDGQAFDVSTQGGAQKVLENIDKFIAAVDSKRAEFGAVQNRLESTIRNQSNVAENVEAARSRIRDTDFAEETSNMIQQNIIQQAAQAMLSQANQRSQMILSLLGG